MERIEALGLVIKAVRQDRKLSQEKLAELAGLHRNFVGLVERNLTKLAVDSLFAIADALDLDASELLARAERLSHVKQKEEGF
jgi:transcriptional regulator with XRE-family HTH domain